MSADLHTLAGAYALDALSPEETRAFAEHLAQCQPCQQEVAELQTTAVHLGLAASEPPPPTLRTTVLEAARQTRQVPPVPKSTDGARRRWDRRRLRLLAAAAAAVVVAGAGGLALGQALDDEPQPQDPIAAVIDAPDARADTVDLRGGGTMTVIRSEQLDRAVVVSHDLPALPIDRTYQLWLVDRAGDARSAGLLADASGTKAVDAHLVRGVRSGDQVAITREPAGGSEQPTMTPLGVTSVT